MSNVIADLQSAEFIENPYYFYEQCRKEASPFLYQPLDNNRSTESNLWWVGHYDQVAQLLKDPRLSKETPSASFQKYPLTPFSQSMLFRDPPDHTRLRLLVNHAFNTSAIRELKVFVEKTVTELLQDLPLGVEVDFMKQFAIQLPIKVITKMLGIPLEDRFLFQDWSTKIALFEACPPLERQTAGSALIDYFRNLIEIRRRCPQNDLISALIQSQEVNSKVSEEELLGICMLLLVAGYETTVNLLGNGLFAFLCYPTQLKLLKEKQGLLLDTAIDEILRFESPVQRATYRVVKETFDFYGITFHKGDEVDLWIGAANRDPRHFPHPDLFDIQRHPNKHIAFGGGIHYCLGAHLARMEARISFSFLIGHFPNLKLSGEPVWNKNPFFRGLASLPIIL